jgi:hypothetical protein
MLVVKTKKKAGSSEPAFFVQRRAYFFISSGFDSLGEAGPGIEGVAEELAAPPAALEAAPVPPGVVVASAPGAGVGVGAGAATGALGAGGGVTTLASSFLQAVRPTATRAAMMSERFMFFSFRRRGDIYGLGLHDQGTPRNRPAVSTEYPVVMNILAALGRRCLPDAYGAHPHSPSTVVAAAGFETSHSSV